MAVAPLPKRLVAMALMIEASRFALAGPAIAAPRAGQTLGEFQNEVTASLAEQGDQMGYGITRCSLSPPFTPRGKTYLARAFSQRTDTVIVLISVRDEKVDYWQEFDLPNLDGWITHYVTVCEGSTLAVGPGRNVQRYRWDGKGFTKLK